MLSIFEVALFICGLYGLIMAKLPSLVFGTGHRIAGAGARLIGALLILPLPGAFVSSVFLALLVTTTEIVALAWIFEFALLSICLLSALVVGRLVRQAVMQ